jgi:chaperonin cofactor prefoldin
MKSASVYTLGLRLDLQEHQKYKRLAEQSGCTSIPMFVQHAVKQYQTVRPEIEKLRWRLRCAEHQLKTAHDNEEIVRAAHEEILAQFRKVIEKIADDKARYQFLHENALKQVATLQKDLNEKSKELQSLKDGINLSGRKS